MPFHDSITLVGILVNRWMPVSAAIMVDVYGSLVTNVSRVT